MSGTEKAEVILLLTGKGRAGSWVRNSGRREWYPDGLESCEDYKTGHWLGDGGHRRMLVAGMVRKAFSEEVMFKLGQE